MNIAILGYGSQGATATEYWGNLGHSITVCDKNPKLKLPDGIKSRLGKNYLSNLDSFDLLVRTPSLHPKEIVAANPDSADILEKVTSVTNEFFRVCPTENIVGVTGTKGKGTTSTLIAKMLEATGKRVHLGGNIGIPPLKLLKNDIREDDWVVLELANFQLIDLEYSPTIAVCLMVEPEHLDWHTNLEEYFASKQRLFAYQNEEDVAIYYAENKNSKKIASVSKGRLIPYMQAPGAFIEEDHVSIDTDYVADVADIKLIGKHNHQNVCAAVTAFWQITKDQKAIKAALQKFSGLPFRIENRGKKHGIVFYNDSFATANGATIAAIEAIPEKKVLILGGFDRGLDLSDLVKTIKNESRNIRKVVVIGASAKRLIAALDEGGFSNYHHEQATSMETIVRTAVSFAEKGDAVVLSPGFASFDMFANFEDRGNQFNRAIENL